MVDEVLKGFNGTIFAYGQTGTGKTCETPCTMCRATSTGLRVQSVRMRSV